MLGYTNESVELLGKGLGGQEKERVREIVACHGPKINKDILT